MNRNKKLLKFLILFFLSWFHLILVKAQTPEKGYIVTIEGDSIVGFIQDGTDSELGSQISFQKEISSESQIFLPSDISAFGFDYGRIFKRTNINNNSINGIDSIYVFGKRIVAGKITLYSWRKPKEDLPFLILINNQSQQTIDLTLPKKLRIDDGTGTRYNSVSSIYLSQLQSLKSDQSVQKNGKLRYGIKPIKKDILGYNKLFINEFPIYEYSPKIDYFHDFSIGYPFKNSGDEVAFRIAFYRNKFSSEETRNYSVLRGFSYRYWSNNSEIDASIRNTTQTYRNQFLTFIPIGINIHSSGKLSTYCYAGVGITFMISSRYNIAEYVDLGNWTEVDPFPIFNFGAGVKVRIASSSIFLEITPTGSGSGSFMNVGFSF